MARSRMSRSLSVSALAMRRCTSCQLGPTGRASCWKILGPSIPAAAMGALLASRRVTADDDRELPGNPFILLLRGHYQAVPAGQGPNLGLSSVNLSDGTYSRTKIYPVFKAPGGTNGEHSDDDAIGTFYVSLATFLCAYDLPGGAITMQFLNSSA